jgi:hypothetical protein
MTDEASAFASAAASLRKKHILCLHHFRMGIFSSSGGMCQDVRTSYIKDVNHLLFHPYKCESEFTAKYQTVLQFSDHASAKKFIEKIWTNRDRTCATFTAAHFTAGHTSTQRAESNNNRIKEGGTLKKQLPTFNLQQLGDHILSIA